MTSKADVYAARRACAHQASLPTLDGHLPHVHLASTGLGIAVVNALCESLEIEVRRDGWSWHQRFARGVPLGTLERGARTERTGTRVRFRADASIFGATSFDRAAIHDRLRELAAFNPSLTFELIADRICEPRGIAALVEASSFPPQRSDAEMSRSRRGFSGGPAGPSPRLRARRVDPAAFPGGRRRVRPRRRFR
jgi:hypothetical protein